MSLEKKVDAHPVLDEPIIEVTDQVQAVDLTQQQRDALMNRLAREANRNNEGIPEEDIEYLLNVIAGMTEEQAVEILTNALDYHNEDPNFPEHTRQVIERLLAGETVGEGTKEDRVETMKLEAALIHFHSPYPDVRGITDPYDDPTMPVETFRAYFLGIVWVIIGNGVNQFFEPRMPNISIPASLLQILLVPCAKIMSYLPDWGFTFRGKRHSLNPGPWNYKEQSLVTIMFGITQSLAYINDQIYVQRLPFWYDNHWAGAGYQILLVLSTQFIGFGLAGLARHVLVYPADRLWPTNFPTLALNRTLVKPEKKENINGWTISRYRFFVYAFIGMFFYFWLPDYLFQALSTFNWMTWIAPDNFNLAAITGSVSGLGLNPIPTFDWNIIYTLTTPLVTPFFSNLNLYIGGLIAGCIIIPAVYWSNMYNTAYLPINSNSVFTNTGEIYSVKEVLTNGVLDEEKYQKYSPPYYAAANLVVYGAFFAMYPAMFVEMLLKDYKIVWKGMRDLALSMMGKLDLKQAQNDAHSRMMRAYKEVPHWWYVLIIVISLVFAIVCVEIYPTDTPVWGIFFGLAISVVFLIPIGILYSTTNALFSLNVITELVAGYALPGKGIALMIIKTFGVNTNLQTIYFTQDQKLGHYAKVPPRATFRAQLIAAFIQCFVVLGVANWQINNYEGICTPGQRQKFTCPNQTTYFSASVVWGVIGPKRVFDHLYPVLKWTFLIGALLPVFFFLLERYTPERIIPRRFWNKFSPLLMMFGMISYFAPYNLSYATGGLYVGWLFMHYLRRRYTAWFEKYNYVLYSALSAGIALSAIIIFFAVQYHPKDLNWWGNTVMYAGQDGLGGPRLPLPEKGYFGLDPGTYP
uniref:ARAD1C10934p n=1 Tax=Blastobotrys adeninivorans TaxID=409370 RepID=A0A060T5C3_BLAAD